MFLPLCVILFTGGGYTPSRQTPPPWTDTLPRHTLPRQTPLKADTLWIDIPPADTPRQTPPRQTPQANTPCGQTDTPCEQTDTPLPPMATVADGKHPTGMHSHVRFICLSVYIDVCCLLSVISFHSLCDRTTDNVLHSLWLPCHHGTRISYLFYNLHYSFEDSVLLASVCL